MISKSVDYSDPDRYGSLLGADLCRPSRSIVLLGASGSVGQTALRYLDRRSDLELIAVSVHQSVSRLREILQVRPDVRFACISSLLPGDQTIQTLQVDYPMITFFSGSLGMIEMIEAANENGADTVLTALVGAAGIRATVRTIELGLKVALANKETLVTAGPAIVALLKKQIAKGEKRAVIMPVDSEHNALFQLIKDIPAGMVRRAILTASGGPFFDFTESQLRSVTKDDVLSHPTWQMGPKITVDSAGMINKGLEIIEAHYLFGVPYEKIGVYVHRKSLVHAMIETMDGGYHMHSGSPDMIFPVAHALDYPEPALWPHPEATFPHEWEPITFYEIGEAQFPGFNVCMEAANAGGTGPAIFNAANEVAVELFLKGIIEFTQIPELIRLVLESSHIEAGEDVEIYLEADRKARERALDFLSSLSEHG